jgi:hypothetical protein
VDLQLDVDLDADTQAFTYNGTEVFSGSWTQQYPGQSVPGILNIGSIDLFANGATAVYYDDIVKLDGAWKFSRRYCQPLLYVGDNAVPGDRIGVRTELVRSSTFPPRIWRPRNKTWDRHT